MLSCVLRVQEGLEVRTESGQVRAARQKAFDSLFRQAPEAPLIRKLALQYGYEIRRPEDYLGDDCVRCGLCLRVCKERIGPAALSFGRKDKVRIVELRAEGLCIGCGACVALCPTGVIKLEDDGETRVVSKNGLVFGSFSNVRCEACGRPCGPRACIDLVTARISGIPAARAGNVCPECLRVSAAEALTGTFPV
jgi:formate hydrogenlyase subunit 6/NADH:ubiquinone oxidoreductase subunit I